MSEFNDKSNDKDKKDNTDSTDEFSMSNYSGYNVSHTENYDSSSNSDNDDYDYEVKTLENNEKKHGKGMGKRIASYVAVGLICSLLGGTVSGVASIYVLPKTSFFKNTPLYKNLANANSNSNMYTDASSGSKNVNASPTVSSGSSLTVAQIAKEVGPAVVGVSTKILSSDNNYGLGNGSSEAEGVGSGIIINKDGYILTNYHVIQGAQTITITLNNKKTAKAKVINYDSSMDLAVIKISDSTITMPGVAELGSSSSLQVGDSVVAIGNPLGLEFFGTVTTGVVSALNRQVSVENSKSQTLIQTDAAINPGNSGGPLVNSQGQVIGITSSKLTDTGEGVSAEGMGFAIPIDVVKPKIASLTKPMLMLGITVEDVTQDDSRSNNVPQGAEVKNVTSGSSADKAGLESSDIITKFGGKTVKSSDDLNNAKAEHSAGDKVAVEIYRNGVNKSLTITLATAN